MSTAAAFFVVGFWFAAGVFGFVACLVAGTVGLLGFLSYKSRKRG